MQDFYLNGILFSHLLYNIQEREKKTIFFSLQDHLVFVSLPGLNVCFTDKKTDSIEMSTDENVF